MAEPTNKKCRPSVGRYRSAATDRPLQETARAPAQGLWRDGSVRRFVLCMMRRRKFLIGLGCASAAVLTVRGRGLCLANPQIVRVRLFSALDVVRIDITSESPLGVVDGARSYQTPSVRLDDSTPVALITGSSPLNVTAYLGRGTNIARTYAGSLRALQIDGKLAIVNEVDIESYVPSVMASEISAGWRPETLKAQAIAVRTYALRRMNKPHAAPYDLGDNTSSQVYRGIAGIAPSYAGAARTTSGLVLTSGARPADVWYHSACGGHTANSAEVTGHAGPPYLQGLADSDSSGRAYCSVSPYFKWRNTVSPTALAKVFDVDEQSLAAVAVADHWPDGRARLVHASLRDGTTKELNGHAFYASAAAQLGYKVLPSALFDVSSSGDSYAFTGHGVGHGVGMCQWGAEGRSRSGSTAQEILAAYFPGTTVASIAAIA
jgi:SpoIID/LytB domain protein